MSMWADYVITAVRFNSSHSHIDSVRCHIDNDNSLGPYQQKSRLEVVTALKNSTTFITAYKNSEGNWTKGKQVYIFKINGKEFLKTVDNSKEEDNLDNLPEF